MRRLYWRIYTGFVIIVLIFALMLAGLWYWSPGDTDREQTARAIGLTLGELLPGADRPAAELQRVLERLGRRFDATLSVHGPGGRFIAGSAGFREPDLEDPETGWIQGRGQRGYALNLPDGRWIVARKQHRRPGSVLIVILALGLAIAIGAHPLARRITRRLERLKAHVDALAEGELSARVAVEGRDEVADLARHFNHAAERIEALVEAQRSTLASASHELRTPLTRIRMAVELFAGSEDPDKRAALAAAIVADIEELDDLIEELLLASRLKAQPHDQHHETLDLLELLAEEGARVSADIDGDPLRIEASPRLLRRLLRNLFENARRYGRGEDGKARISASVDRGPDGDVVIRVEDRGPGIAQDLQERIFEPYFRPPGIREGEDPGVGLGLSLVREISRHYGGDVRYEPRPGGGSRFDVILRFEAAAAARRE